MDRIALKEITKNELRKIFKQIRKEKHLNIQNDKQLQSIINKKFEENLLKLIKQTKFYITDEFNIACYYSVFTEINSIKLIKNLIEYHLQDKRINLLLPRMIDNTKILKFYTFRSESDLVLSNSFKIKEPDTDKCVEMLPDIIITPLLAFDNNKYRLGYGAGFYDYTYNYLKSINHEYLSIGIAYDEMYIENLPYDQYDIPLDYIVTPTKII